jgi:drug/metabolite transporter (DMT)-like permease
MGFDMAPSRNAVLANVILIAATWGSAVTFIKIATVAGMPPIAIAVIRSAICAAAFITWLLLWRQPFRCHGKMRRHMVVLGLLNGLIPNVLIGIALTSISSAPAAIIQSSVPVIVAVLASFALPNERLRQLQAIGFLASFLGVCLVIGPTAIAEGKANLIGALAMIGAAVSYACATVYLKLAKPEDLFSAALGQQVISLVASIGLSLMWIPDYTWQLPSSVWLALFGLGAISTAIPTIMYFRLVAIVPAAKAALVQYLLPIMASLYAVMFLGEALHLNVVIGGGVVLLGVWLAATVRSTTSTQDRIEK